VEALLQAKALQPVEKAGAHLLRAKPPDPPEVEGVGQEGEVEVEVAAPLQEDPELVPLGPAPPALLLQVDLPLLQQEEAQDHLHQGGLARPVGAQEAQDLPRP